MKLKLLNSKEMAYAPQKQAFPARRYNVALVDLIIEYQ